ncbi:MAG: cupin domain-containing protein [Burkholderiales bacterium]|jgi:quercetin dioxygenase-like cupin family protein
MNLPSAPDINDVKSDWRSRGFSCEVWTDAPGQVWADFVHDVDELVMVIDGEVEFEFNGSALRPHTGEELMIPAGAPHTVRNVGQTTSRWLFGYRR